MVLGVQCSVTQCQEQLCPSHSPPWCLSGRGGTCSSQRGLLFTEQCLRSINNLL